PRRPEPVGVHHGRWTALQLVGTATIALVIAAAAGASATARAEPCTGLSSKGVPFAACFDLGNRLSVTAGSDGVGGTLSLRHDITFEDDPDLVWKMDHTILDGVHSALENRFSGTLYRGRYIRHARD